MLSKLLKYEFKAVGRLMLPLYGAWLVMSFILGFLLDFLDKLMIVGVLATLIYVAITMTVVVLT
ncbi:MAG: ABC transporter permease, partial [Anaerovoracaceae bacterium]